MDDPSHAEAQRDRHIQSQQPTLSLNTWQQLCLGFHRLRTFLMSNLWDATTAVCLCALLILTVLSTPKATSPLPDRRALVYSWLRYSTQCVVFIYALILTLIPFRWKKRLVANAQRTLVLLAVWVLYAHRDIWPLATFTLAPLDGDEGMILWAKVLLLTVAAIVIPLISPHPLSESSDPAAISSEHTASILSSFTYSWLDPLISKAQHMRTLPVDQMPLLAEYNSIDHLVRISEKHVDPMRVDAVQKESKLGIAWGLARLFRRDLSIMSSMVVIASATSFLAPLGLKHILSYIEDGGVNEALRPWFWLVVLLIGSMAVSLAMQYYHYVSTQVVARTQSIVTQLIFDHSLRMRSKVDTSKYSDAGPGGKTKTAMPTITNLVTTDLTNVTNASTFVLLILLETPIQLVGSVYFLFTILGWSAFIGISVMILLFPIPGRLSLRTLGVQREKARQTDKRVTLVRQMLNAVRTIKLLGWEDEQGQKIEGARIDELSFVRKANMLQIWIGCINVCIPLLIMLASYATFTVVMKRQLSASIVFSSISLFEILRTQYGSVFFRFPILSQGLVSLTRINEFLRKTELLDEFTPGEDGVFPSWRVSLKSGDIAVRAMHFTWTSDHTADTGGFSLKIDKELFFRKDSINLVHGPTACGKTSLLMALLGEMHAHPLGPQSLVSFPGKARVAYAAQESWVLADTVRNNILFGTAYDEDRYRAVLYACALHTDIAIWSDGDDTLVGERGVTLSGGQKARLTLARAVYSDTEVVLLDDVLAALDNSTILHVIEHLFQGTLLRGRTVIIVSNNVKALKSVAGWVVELGANGNFVKAGRDPKRAATDAFVSAQSNRLLGTYGPSRVVKEEEKEEGHIGLGPMKLLFKNMSPHPGLYWLVFLVLLFLFSLITNAQIWLLGFWAEQYSEQPTSQISISLYLGIYVALVLAAMLTHVAAQSMHLVGSLEASAVIHKKLIASVLGTTFRWLDSTPTSRIVARCTDDIGTIDGQICPLLFKLLDMTVAMLLRVVIVMVLTPAFTIAVAVVSVFCGLCARAYMKAQLPVKREQSNTRAPLLGHLNNSITGIVSIRAYKAQESFRGRMYVYIDNWTRVTNTFYNLNRWIIVRADLTGAVFSVALAAYMTYFAKANASKIGLSLNMAVACSSKVFEWVRTLNTFEVSGNSLERMDQYLRIEQEATPGAVDPDAWPEDGELDVRNLKAYYEGDHEVLKGVTFKAKPGDRIGIVGRTGSGKSTLLLALLRCIHTSSPGPHSATITASSDGGSATVLAANSDNSSTSKVVSETTDSDVLYSGQSIFSISLSKLRKNVTVIPQTPELFFGTIRENLDPFAQRNEEELDHALLRAQGLDEQTGALHTDRLKLDTEILAGGENLSAGQRQMIALARAMIRKSKLLFMDEATSSIDYESDHLIQSSLHKYLDRNVTVLTVAHRLSTIKNYNKVLVLDGGNQVEYGDIRTLLHDETSYFSQLVDAAPDVDRDALFDAVGPGTPSTSVGSFESEQTKC